MKKLLLILLILLFPLILHAEEWQSARIMPGVMGSTIAAGGCTDTNPQATAGPPRTYTCTGMLVCQNAEAFDNTNCSTTDIGDNSEEWTCTLGTGAAINLADTTATILRGAQQIKLTGGTSTAEADLDSPVFAATSPLYFHFQMRPTVGTTHSLFKIYHGTAASVCVYRILNNGLLEVASTNGSQVATVDALTSGTKYHIWGSYTLGTGANAICTVNFSESATKPADSGNQYAISNDGNHTVGATYFGFTVSAAVVDYFDQILVSASPITKVCEE